MGGVFIGSYDTITGNLVFSDEDYQKVMQELIFCSSGLIGSPRISLSYKDKVLNTCTYIAIPKEDGSGIKNLTIFFIDIYNVTETSSNPLCVAVVIDFENKTVNLSEINLKDLIFPKEQDDDSNYSMNISVIDSQIVGNIDPVFRDLLDASSLGYLSFIDINDAYDGIRKIFLYMKEGISGENMVKFLRLFGKDLSTKHALFTLSSTVGSTGPYLGYSVSSQSVLGYRIFPSISVYFPAHPEIKASVYIGNSTDESVDLFDDDYIERIVPTIRVSITSPYHYPQYETSGINSGV